MARKLINLITKYRLNGGEWVVVNHWNNFHYWDEETIAKYEFETKEMNFQETKELIEEGLLLNCETGKSFLFKKDYIELASGSILDGPYRYYEKNVKSVEVVREAIAPTIKLTMKDLNQILAAEEFCDYLKDRGITLYTK